MPLNLGDVFPNASVRTSAGDFKLHDYFGDGWGLLFSHPADYTPVCTTELGLLAQTVPQFAARNAKVIALSIDSVEHHHGWIKDIQAFSGLSGEFPYPIIADDKRELAESLGMLDPDELDKSGMPVTARAVFIVGPDRKVKLSILYPATTGRNFNEILRVLDSLQLTATKKVATPGNWVAGGDCMVIPSVKPEEQATLFPKGVTTKEVPSGKGYLRITPQP